MARTLRGLARLAAALLAVAGLALLGAGIEPRDQALAGAGRQEEPPDRETLRRRAEEFLRLAPEEQERLRRAYEDFRALPPEERRLRELVAARLDRIARRLYDEDLTDGERARLARVEPERRERIVFEMAAAELAEQNQRILEKLPEDLRRMLEGASRHDRRAALQKFQAEQARLLGETLERLALVIGIDEATVARLQALELEQRKLKFLELAKRVSVEELEREDLPANLPPERLRMLLALEPHEFADALLRLRQTHPGLGLPGRGAGGAAEVEPERRRALLRLREALRAAPGDWIEASELGPRERQRAVLARKRERALLVLREEALLPPERVAELERESDPRFVMVVRGLCFPGARSPYWSDASFEGRPSALLERLRLLRERWNRLGEAERAELARRLDELEARREQGALGPQQRQEELSRWLLRMLPEDDQRRLEGLPLAERREKLLALVQEELGLAAGGAGEVLPTELREALGLATLDELEQMLRELQAPGGG